jgi:hypothetical protein
VCNRSLGFDESGQGVSFFGSLGKNTSSIPMERKAKWQQNQPRKLQESQRGSQQENRQENQLGNRQEPPRRNSKIWRLLKTY